MEKSWNDNLYNVFNFFLLVLGAVLIFKNLWKIRYENYLVIAQICLTMTLIFCYFSQNLERKSRNRYFYNTIYFIIYSSIFISNIEFKK